MWLLFSMSFLAGCALPKPIQSQAKEKPGLHSLTGWNAAGRNDIDKTFTGKDIEGKVGYRLEVSAPTANCVSPSKKWTGYHKIVSGQLPPGLDFNETSWIKGIPTKRGNYIVVLELYDIKCNDSYYGPYKQELRFHITGVGIVND